VVLLFQKMSNVSIFLNKLKRKSEGKSAASTVVTVSASSSYSSGSEDSNLDPEDVAKAAKTSTSHNEFIFKKKKLLQLAAKVNQKKTGESTFRRTTQTSQQVKSAGHCELLGTWVERELVTREDGTQVMEVYEVQRIRQKKQRKLMKGEDEPAFIIPKNKDQHGNTRVQFTEMMQLQSKIDDLLQDMVLLRRLRFQESDIEREIMDGTIAEATQTHDYASAVTYLQGQYEKLKSLSE
jgi:hypothetical protein